MGRISVDFTFAAEPKLPKKLRRFTLSLDSETPPEEIEQQGRGNALDICYNYGLTAAVITRLSYKPRGKSRIRKR